MRLIDADELIPLIKMGECNSYDDLCRGRNGGIDFAIERIKQMPSVERKTGKWIEVEVFPESYDIYGEKTWSSEMQCNQCGFRHTAIEGHMAQYNYCPNCGADMRSEE